MTRTIPGSWPVQDLPFLNEQNCEETSPFKRRYNCIAWAVGDTSRKWWPGIGNQGYWPPGVPREETIAAFMEAFATLGYQLCYDERLEDGVEKLAIYGIVEADGTVTPTHAARQLASGKWTSKLGDFEDISHETVDDVNGPVYGHMICCVSRPRT